MNQPNPSVVKSLQTAVRFMQVMGIVVVIGILCSGITFVQPDEVALILRFGKLVGDTPAEQIHKPGLLLAFPYLIDQVVRVPVKRVQEVQIDGLNALLRDEQFIQSGYLITGDQNIVLLDAKIKYQIADPIKYALQVAEPQHTLKDLVIGALTSQIAGQKVDFVLAEGKKELANAVVQDAQNRANGIGLGVNLVALEFNTLQPPMEVKEEFEMVTSNYVMKETMLQEARRYREERIPNAMAERDSAVQKAVSDQMERVAQAKVDVAQFYGLIVEYAKNPDVVKERIYREKVAAIMQKIEDQVLLPDGSGKVILPYTKELGKDVDG